MVTGLDWVIVIAYMLGMVGIGFYSHTKVSNFEDHILSGRNVPTYYLAPCLLTTQIGAGSIIGYVGACYAMGVSGAWWVYGNIVTFIVLGAFGAKKLRGATMANTLPQWFEIRYDKKCKTFASITTFLAELAFTAGQIVGGGILLNVVLGWNLQLSILLFSVVVLIYSAIGGLWAVFLTDFVQAIVMVIGLSSLVIMGTRAVGGFQGLVASCPDGYFDLIPDGNLPTIIASVLYSVPAIFCAFDVIQKVMAAKSPQVASRSCFFAAGGVVFFAIAVPMIGVLGYVILGPAFENPEMITHTLIAQILPTGLKGLAIAAVLSTLMSSTDACLMAASSVLTNDIWGSFTNIKAHSEKKVLRVSVILTAAMGAIAWVLAAFFSNALGMMELAWTLLSCGAFIPLMGGLFWKKSSTFGAFSSMILGAAIGLAWTFAGNPLGLKPVIPAYIVGIVALIVGSYMKPALGMTSEEMVKQSEAC